ncbi:MAG: single-stranded DNA-binding protein [Candidatus Sericytochromatia bacterium]|nr:single-stranded DNA-binding protein [Candidatus Sericytochromatia bacterium]
MSMVNSVVLVGRAGADPEVRVFEPSGDTIVKFNLAVNRPVRRQEGVDSTDWFRIELRGRQTDAAAKYIRKGGLVGIQGRLELDKYKDREGQMREIFVIRANNFQLLGSRNDRQDGLS